MCLLCLGVVCLDTGVLGSVRVPTAGEVDIEGGGDIWTDQRRGRVSPSVDDADREYILGCSLPWLIALRGLRRERVVGV